MQEKKNTSTLWTGTFVLLILLNLLNGMVGQMTVPLVAKFSYALTPDLTLASTVAGLMSLMSLFICPVAGVLSDRLNKKKLLLITMAGYGLSVLLHALAYDVRVLILLRLITGAFFSVSGVTMIAFSSLYVPRERLGEGMGYITLATILAQAVGPAVGLELVGKLGYQLTFAVSGIIALAAAAVILILPYQKEEVRVERKKFAFRDVFAMEFFGFMLLAALFSSGNGMVSTYLAILADERRIPNIALFFTVYSVCLVLLRPMTGKLLDKRGVYVILLPSVLFAALGMVFIGVGYTLPMMIAAGVFKAMGQGSGIPSLQAYAVKSLDKERSGVAVSTIMIGQNVGNALAPIAGSFFVKSFGYEGMFCGFGAVMLVGGLILLLCQYKKEKGK